LLPQVLIEYDHKRFKNILFVSDACHSIGYVCDDEIVHNDSANWFGQYIAGKY
jgi:hypothetical protein